MEWISVKDSLPDGLGHVNVIAYSPHGYLFGAMYNCLTKMFQRADFSYVNNVTHWMPLPDPPS